MTDRSGAQSLLQRCERTTWPLGQSSVRSQTIQACLVPRGDGRTYELGRGKARICNLIQKDVVVTVERGLLTVSAHWQRRNSP